MKIFLELTLCVMGVRIVVLDYFVLVLRKSSTMSADAVGTG